jgi:glycosyltransferase involved in cell wall biosynthesis
MKNNRPIRIAVMGHRGIPNTYGGFETFAQELCTRLVKIGFDVTSYNRLYKGAEKLTKFHGVDIVNIPSVKRKTLDTILHTFMSVIHASFKRYDAIVMVNVGNAPLALIPRLAGIPVLLNVDGLEWERKKWGILAKLYLRICARIATFAASEIITDAKVIEAYYKEKFQKESTMIPYGAKITRKPYHSLQEKFGIEPEKYFLYVSRFEPENNPHLVVKAFEKADTPYKLVMVGGSTYNPEFERQIRSTLDKRIVFLGFVYGKNYKILQQNAYAYIQATEVGGTHPALIEAMGYGNAILANNTADIREVTNGSAEIYNINEDNLHELTRLIERLSTDQARVHDMRQKSVKRVEKAYSWDYVTAQYIDLITGSIQQKQAHRWFPARAR